MTRLPYLITFLLTTSTLHALQEPLPLSVSNSDHQEKSACALLNYWTKEATLEAPWPKELSDLVYNYVQPPDVNIGKAVRAPQKKLTKILQRFQQINTLTITQIPLKRMPINPFNQIRHLHLADCAQLKTLPELFLSVDILSLERCNDLLEIKQLHDCKQLDITRCKQLETLPEFPYTLKRITLSYCPSLKKIPKNMDALFINLEGVCCTDLSTLTRKVKHLCCSLLRVEHIGPISRFDKLTARSLSGRTQIQDGVYFKGVKSSYKHPLQRIKEAIASSDWSDEAIIELIKPHIPVPIGLEEGNFRMDMITYITYINHPGMDRRFDLLTYLLSDARYDRKRFDEVISGVRHVTWGV